MRALLPLLFLGCAGLRTTADAPAGRPNVVVIITDDQGWGDFSFRGGGGIDTPRLDRLAAEGTRVENFYVHPVCAPTRASLMTGRWCQRTRAFDTWVGRAMLEPQEVTLAEVLGGAGYRTGLFGKWHLGDCFPMRPQDQGFQEVLMHRGGGIGQPADPEGGEGRYTDAVLFDEDGTRVETKGYCTQVYVDAAIEFARASVEEGEAFFTYLATNAPHSPFHDVPRDLYEKYQARDLSPAAFAATEGGHPLPGEHDEDQLARIFAMVEDVDRGVGRLLDALDELGVSDDTLVLFLLDNGPNSRRFVGGMRGQKTSVYEGGVRSPLFARWPGHIPAGHVIAPLSANVDVLPTIAEACGVSLAGLDLDGRSLLGQLESRAAEWLDREVVIQAHRGDQPIPYHNALLRTQRWKLVNPSGFQTEHESVVPRWELYDMCADPLETNDLAAERPEVVADLAARYDAWFADVSSTRPDPYSPPAIIVGHARSPKVHLTRQDWRKLGPGNGWAPNANGAWRLDVVDEGPYTIRVRFHGKIEPTQVELAIGDWSLAGAVVPGAREHTFEGVRLPLGDGRLIGSLVAADQVVGPYQVILQHD
ncbi:MAG: arylsulfatase [Planctomycetota bacterium]|nr:arylsulfatase [Planctomycetota bacterium]